MEFQLNLQSRKVNINKNQNLLKTPLNQTGITSLTILALAIAMLGVATASFLTADYLNHHYLQDVNKQLAEQREIQKNFQEKLKDMDEKVLGLSTTVENLVLPAEEEEGEVPPTGIPSPLKAYTVELDGFSLSKSMAGLKVSDSYDDNFLTTATNFGGDVSGTYNAIIVADDSHSHSGLTISGIDISDDTNLSADGTEIILTDDALSLGSGITRDAEWDTISEIEAATGADIITSLENNDGLVGTKNVDETGLAGGKILKYNTISGNWEIGDDNDTTYTADGEGLELSGNQFSLELDGTTLSKSASGLKIADSYDDNFFVQNGNSFGSLATLGTNDNNALAFKTNNVEKLRITATGEVGIGTSAPGALLQIETPGGSPTKPFAVIAQGNTIIDTTANGGITIGNTTSAQPVTIDAGTANLNIGTSNNAKTINIGTGTASDTINIATGDTATDTVNIGNSGTATTLTYNSGATNNALTVNTNAVTTGTAMKINSTGLTTGNALEIIGPALANLLTVGYNSDGILDFARVAIGGTQQRDQFYVFGRMNSSWRVYQREWMATCAPPSAVTADTRDVCGLLFDEDTDGAIEARVAGSRAIRLRASTAGSLAVGEGAILGSGGVMEFSRANNPVMESSVRVTSGLTNHRVEVGFSDRAINGDIATDPANGAYFRALTAGNWIAVTRSGGVETATDTGVAVSAVNYQTLRIEINDATNVKFLINNTIVATHTTNIPAVDLGFSVGNALITATASGVRNFDLESLKVWIDDPPIELVKEVSDGSIAAQINEEDISSDNKNSDTNIASSEEEEVDIHETIAEMQKRLDVLASKIGDLSIDKDGNIKIAGLLQANKLKAEEIEGLLISAQPSSVEKKEENTPAEVTFEKAKITLDLAVLGKAQLDGSLIVIGDTKFSGKVTFAQPPLFSADTAGTIKIKQGEQSAEVVFQKAYSNPPAVNVTLEANGGSLEEAVLSGEIRYIVTNRTASGFTIKLSAPAPQDATFSWTAFATQ